MVRRVGQALTTCALLVVSVRALHMPTVREVEPDLPYEGLDHEGRALLREDLDQFRSISDDSVRFYRAVDDGTSPSEAVKKATPLHWLHVPKTGSSFLNTLINVPGVCPGLPGDTVLTVDKFGARLMAGFSAAYDIPKVCPGIDKETALSRFSHIGVGNLLYNRRLSYRGTGKKVLFGFFRQPEQRIISSYNDFLVAMHRGDMYFNPTASWSGHSLHKPSNLTEFARTVSGCGVRMLTRPGFSCGQRSEPTQSETETAIERLRSDFAFVGITDQWDLSICLFSKMFNTSCHAYQFSNTRPGTLANKKMYHTRGLDGYVDKHDGQLYNEAVEIFNQNLKRYNVNSQTCQACFSAK